MMTKRMDWIRGLAPCMVLIASAMTIPVVPAAAADNLKFSFCTDTTENCVTIQVWNTAGVTVTKTKVTQKSSDIATCEQISKTAKQNLPGGDGPQSGKFTFRADAKCQYRVKYSTTSGCIGDKKANLKPDDVAKGRSVYLDRSCGSLAAYVAN